MAELPTAPAWLESLRRAGAARFDEAGYPTNPKLEAWRFTNIRPIVETEWHPAVCDSEAAQSVFQQYKFGGDAIEIVISNGHFVPALSNLENLPPGVIVEPLTSAQNGPHAELVRKHLGSRAKAEKNPFVALNQAHLNGGVFIHIARGVGLVRPIHLVIVASPDEVRGINYPRVLVVVEDSASCTLVQSYVGPGKGVYFTNAVTEIIAGNEAIVDHYKLNQESPEAFHISAMEVIIGKQAQFIDHNITLGGAITRNDIAVRLNGESSYSVLNGLTILDGNQLADNHTLLEHAYPNCPSYELYKHVLDGRSQCIFKGQIFVHDVAQKTDAKQSSKTLLLSDDAQMNSQPALEIYADDVKCTHGSTTGPVDDSMLFYLQTRGLNREQSEQLLIYAFAADVTRRIKVEAVRTRIESWMAAKQQLPQDFRIQELGSHDDDAVY